MTARPYGPVELFIIKLDGGLASAEPIVSTLRETVTSETARVIDIVIVTKADDGTLSIVEVEIGDLGFAAPDLLGHGIISESDIHDLAGTLPAGETGVITAIEMTWMRNLTSSLDSARAEVLRVERIPARAVNDLAHHLATTETGA